MVEMTFSKITGDKFWLCLSKKYSRTFVFIMTAIVLKSSINGLFFQKCGLSYAHERYSLQGGTYSRFHRTKKKNSFQAFLTLKVWQNWSMEV